MTEDEREDLAGFGEVGDHRAGDPGEALRAAALEAGLDADDDGELDAAARGDDPVLAGRAVALPPDEGGPADDLDDDELDEPFGEDDDLLIPAAPERLPAW